MRHDTKNQTPAQRVTNPVWLRQQIAELVTDCEDTIAEEQALADKERDDGRRAIHRERVESHQYWKKQFERVLSGKTSDDDLQAFLTNHGVGS